MIENKNIGGLGWLLLKHAVTWNLYKLILRSDMLRLIYDFLFLGFYLWIKCFEHLYPFTFFVVFTKAIFSQKGNSNYEFYNLCQYNLQEGLAQSYYFQILLCNLKDSPNYLGSWLDSVTLLYISDNRFGEKTNRYH